jgi:hypothetical protein
MILLVNKLRSDGNLLSSVDFIGEVTESIFFNKFSTLSDKYIIISSNSNEVFSSLIDVDNSLFFIVSSDNCIQIIKRGLCEWIKEGKSLKVYCSVIDSHYVSPGSYFGRIWKSYLRNKSLDDLLDKKR